MPLLNLPVIQRIRQRLGLRARLFYLQVTTLIPPRELTPEESEIAEKYKRGIAEALGVPESAINENMVKKWVTGWAGAMINPEYLKEHPEVAEKLGLVS